jgi:hypothetical protein
MVTLSGTCRLRRVFTLRDPPYFYPATDLRDQARALEL